MIKLKRSVLIYQEQEKGFFIKMSVFYQYIGKMRLFSLYHVIKNFFLKIHLFSKE